MSENSKQFDKIGLITKRREPAVVEAVEVICELLKSLNKTIVFDKSSEDTIDTCEYEVVNRSTLGSTTDLCIVVGGDGTLLNAARSLSHHDIPLLGINLGRLGFLTDISPDDMVEKLTDIFAGQYNEEPRALLQASIHRDGELINESCAFNDVVVHKWNGARMLEYETYIDGQFINTTRSDGLIVSTPTGSTGYALSGGGPILHPSLHAIVLVPICPHSMTYRPLVVFADAEIEIIVKDCNQAEAQVTCDGQINLGLQAEDRITIARHASLIQLVHPMSYDYFSILRAKLHWGKRLT